LVFINDSTEPHPEFDNASKLLAKRWILIEYLHSA
jgi:hypothetical protein